MEQGNGADRTASFDLTCVSKTHPPARAAGTRTFLLKVYMSKTSNPYLEVPVKRMQLDIATGTLVESPLKKLFIRGPIPLGWLTRASELPGKTLNTALALWWHHGMAKEGPFKLTQKALNALNVKRDAASTSLTRLEQAGLIRVLRRPGQRPTITLVLAPAKKGR